MIKKNITAYNIDGEYYLHRGKPNARTKKKIKKCIQENQEALERGETQKTIHCYSFVDGWEKKETPQTWEQDNNESETKKITNKPKEKSWLQLTLPL